MENPVQQAQDIAYYYGVTPEQFWEFTPYLLSRYVKAQAEKEAKNHRREMSLVWHGAAFARAKRLPDHTVLMNKLGEKPTITTKEDLVKTFKNLQKVYGGKLTIGGKVVN